MKKHYIGLDPYQNRVSKYCMLFVEQFTLSAMVSWCHGNKL